jgi:hypothetical protein
MAPFNNDMGSISALLSSKGGERMGRMNSIQRISARSLMLLRPRGKNAHDKSDTSLRDLLREHSQPTPSIISPPSPSSSTSTEKNQEPSVILEEQEKDLLREHSQPTPSIVSPPSPSSSSTSTEKKQEPSVILEEQEKDLLREHSQPTPSIVSPPSTSSASTEKKQEPSVILDEQEKDILSSDATARTEDIDVMLVPVEVTVISDESGVKDDYRAIRRTDMKLDSMGQEYEAREQYFQQIKASKDEVKTLSKQLKKSKKRVQELILHNTTMLDQLKAITKKEEATVDTHAMFKQEITLLKTCLFLSMIFVMCGGRAEFIALVVFGWAVADVFI